MTYQDKNNAHDDGYQDDEKEVHDFNKEHVHERTKGWDPVGHFKSLIVKTLGGHPGHDSKGLLDWFKFIPALRLYREKPIIAWHDFQAALTTACVLLAQAIAYAQLAKVPVQNSLVSGMAPLIIYAIFGACPQLSAGPEAVTTMLTGLFVATELGRLNQTHSAAQIAAVLCFTTGICSILLGLLDCGFVSNLINGYLMNGYVLGVALLIAIEQLPVMMGFSGPPAADTVSSLRKLIHVFDNIKTTHTATLIVSLLCLIFLWGMQFLHMRFNSRSSWIKKAPDVLILVLLSISFSYTLDLGGSYGVQTLGYIDFSNYKVEAPPLADSALFVRSIQSGLIISVLGFIECMVVARHFGLRNNYEVSENRELVSLGLGNFVGSFFGTYAAFGSLPRSRVFANAGAKTMLAGLFTCIIFMLFTFALLTVLEFLPTACANTIVFVAALNLIEWEEMIFVMKFMRVTDIFFMFLTFVLTFFVSIEYGILLVLLVSLLMVMKRASNPDMTMLGLIKTEKNSKYGFELTGRLDKRECLLAEGVLILSVRSTLQFYNCGQIRKHVTNCIHHLDDILHRGYRRNLPGEDLFRTKSLDYSSQPQTKGDTLRSRSHDSKTVSGIRPEAQKEENKNDQEKSKRLASVEQFEFPSVVEYEPFKHEPRSDIEMLVLEEHPQLSHRISSLILDDKISPNMLESASECLVADRSDFSISIQSTPAKSLNFDESAGIPHQTTDKHHKPLKAIIFDMFAAGDFDSSALHILKEILVSYRQQGIHIFFARLHPWQEDALRRVGIIHNIGGNEMIFDSIHDAVVTARSIVGNPSE